MGAPVGRQATPFLLKKIDLLLKSLSTKPNVVVKKVRDMLGHVRANGG